MLVASGTVCSGVLFVVSMESSIESLDMERSSAKKEREKAQKSPPVEIENLEF